MQLQEKKIYIHSGKKLFYKVSKRVKSAILQLYIHTYVYSRYIVTYHRNF